VPAVVARASRYWAGPLKLPALHPNFVFLKLFPQHPPGPVNTGSESGAAARLSGLFTPFVPWAVYPLGTSGGFPQAKINLSRMIPEVKRFAGNWPIKGFWGGGCRPVVSGFRGRSLVAKGRARRR
jgi:hypothetical protein